MNINIFRYNNIINTNTNKYFNYKNVDNKNNKMK